MNYIIGIDQSTQGTKTIVFDETGKIIEKAYLPHKQHINELGYVSHDIEEIYTNVVQTVKIAVKNANIKKENIVAIGISNQRESTAIWDRSAKALHQSVVWQCARASKIAEERSEYAALVLDKTGLPLSPYFPASKMRWLLEHCKIKNEIFMGTMDSYLVYRLTRGESFKTDYTNASRTQLFNIQTLTWDEELLKIFDIPRSVLPSVCDSDSNFGETDLDGFLNHKIPIHCVMGDSHAALFGQGCHKANTVKATYGTGSSIMMNTGAECKKSSYGLASSIAWSRNGKVSYVLEGNINYTGAVIAWLQNDLGFIKDTSEIEDYIISANEHDTTTVVPAFTGLSAPHWINDAKAMICGMTRTTKKAEIIKASVESIAFQIQDVISAMEKDSQGKIKEMRVDGGPTRNKYLMQFQSDIGNLPVEASKAEELSAIGVAYMAGIALGLYEENKVFHNLSYQSYVPRMSQGERDEKIKRWQKAVSMIQTFS